MSPNNKGYYPSLFKVLGLRARLPRKVVGKYSTVSSIKFRIPNGPLCQIFYPATLPQDQSSLVRTDYVRPQVSEGMAKFSGVSKTGFSIIYKVKHHVYNALPIDPAFMNSAAKGKNPTILFSHGLAGNAEIYSVLCRDLASCGYYVFALEHEDGSGSYAQTVDGEDIFYTFNPPEGYLWNVKSHVVEFRRPYLEKRLSEISAVYEFVQSAMPQQTSNDKSEQILSSIMSNIDPSNVAIAGHSFGAATVTLASQVPSSNGEASRFTCAIILDIWSDPIPTENLEKGISIPTLSILSEQFTVNEFADQTKLLVKASDAHSYYISKTIHQDFSDTPFWAPRLVTKGLKLGGKGGRKLVQETIVDTCESFLGQYCTIEPENIKKAADEDIISKRHPEVVVKF